jgi:hypothetical protein
MMAQRFWRPSVELIDVTAVIVDGVFVFSERVNI